METRAYRVECPTGDLREQVGSTTEWFTAGERVLRTVVEDTATGGVVVTWQFGEEAVA